MRTRDDIDRAAAERNLRIAGLVNLSQTECVVLLSPREPDFWAHFSASAEYHDGQADPLDRWSKRVITDLAQHCGGTAVFPSDGPPYPPFIRWALDSGEIFPSPVGLLVHAQMGLFVSFRGALRLSWSVGGSSNAPSPCDSCPDQPCLTACPVSAMGLAQDYDLARCHSFLDTTPGRDCMGLGCAVRRACPAGQSYGRRSEQSAFHMKAFHP